MRKADKTRHTGKKKYGKRIIAAVLILAAAAVTGFFVYRHFHKQEEMPADASGAGDPHGSGEYLQRVRKRYQRR